MPFGVLLKRALIELGVRDVEHYGVSIILDRGIDDVAINYILNIRPAAGVAFVDGWTGKGMKVTYGGSLHRPLGKARMRVC